MPVPILAVPVAFVFGAALAAYAAFKAAPEPEPMPKPTVVYLPAPKPTYAQTVAATPVAKVTPVVKETPKVPTLPIHKGFFTQVESQNLEFKYTVKLPPAKTCAQMLAKYMCGFLNSCGGSLFMGVQDDGRVMGYALTRDYVDDIKLQLDHLAQVKMTPAVDPVLFDIVLHALPNKKFLIELNVKKPTNHREVYNYNGDYWARSSASTRKLSDHSVASRRRTGRP